MPQVCGARLAQWQGATWRRHAGAAGRLPDGARAQARAPMPQVLRQTLPLNRGTAKLNVALWPMSTAIINFNIKFNSAQAHHETARERRRACRCHKCSNKLCLRHGHFYYCSPLQI
eukprot:TRINITY_DN6856_c0_g1_i2.p2 TRINITY_DN6856_c0_g1~~TRINITY_DN6856_c0_g1_i2.p2  ORF type:complete len:116 (-),score=12.39 TRINITY_DN6856_c0_g1_i2:258-605(-)